MKAKGRKLSDSGDKARLYHAVCEARLAKIVKIDLKSELFATRWTKWPRRRPS